MKRVSLSENGESMANTEITPETVTDFWRKAGPECWFVRDKAFDAEISRRFQDTWRQAEAGKLRGWQETDEGLLACILVLDQFPRNMFRNDPRAFSTDEQARTIARLALEKQADTRTEATLRGFLYLPFEHSENAGDQDLSVKLFRRLGDPEMLRYAEIHRDVIRRFGRFPHRNSVLGRETTADEQRFLDEGSFAG